MIQSLAIHSRTYKLPVSLLFLGTVLFTPAINHLCEVISLNINIPEYLLLSDWGKVIIT